MKQAGFTGRICEIVAGAEHGPLIVLLLLVLVGVAPTPVSAQPEQNAFRHLTIADGLSQNAVFAIVQDHRGFMWFGTKNGLNRYDGYTLDVFRQNPFDSTSVASGHVTALLEDSRHFLWVGTHDGGLNRFDRERENFHRYLNGPTQPITSIAEDQEGSLWLGTDGSGLYRLHHEDVARPHARFDHFAHDPAVVRSLSSNHVKDVLADRTGAMWVATHAGVDRHDTGARSGERDSFTRYDLGLKAPPAEEDAGASALYEDRHGRVWVGSASGLSVFRRDTEQFAHYHHRYHTYRYGWGNAVDVIEAASGHIWLSTYAELMRFDPETETFASFQHDPSDPRSMSSNAPTALFQDRSRVLWVGTSGHGINMYDPKAERFRTFRPPRDNSAHVGGVSVYTLFEDDAGHMWINAGVLYKWNRTTGSIRSFEAGSNRPDAFGNSGVWSIVQDTQGSLWAATQYGLYHFDPVSESYRRYQHDPADPNGLPESEVYGVYLDHDGALWTVTVNFLSKLTDADAGHFTSYRYTEQPAAREWIFPSMHQDVDGVFWLASNRGLVRFDPKTETVRHYRTDPRQPASLSHNVVRSICPDPREPGSYLWLGTAGGGLNRFDLESETFTHFTEEDGLSNNVVYGILADEAGRLWMSTNTGLSRFDPATERFRNYDARDGLQSNEFNSGSYFKSASGELFFGGIYGFNYFQPDEIEDNPHVPEVVITGFKRLNNTESVRDSSTLLTKAIAMTDTLRLGYRDDVITFEFAVLDYSAPAKNRYAYRMEGFNDEWIQSGSVRSATYTNLPPGSYTFRVKGSNNDGVWNEEGASVALVIAPPPWETWWAYTLYALVAGLVLYGLRRYEMNRLRLKSHLEIEQLEAEQLRDLDRTKSQFFANISHEFRTPLTLTLGPLDDLIGGVHGSLDEAVAGQLRLVRRNARRLLGLINELLDVARLESGRLVLQRQVHDLSALVRHLTDGYVVVAERQGLDFRVEVPEAVLPALVDVQQLEKAIGNLLSNAVKFTPRGGAVTVRLASSRAAGDGQGAWAQLDVADTGPGIPAEELSFIFDRFYQAGETSATLQPGTGIGLALASELVELHEGALTVASEVGVGTTFTLRLPLRDAELQDASGWDDWLKSRTEERADILEGTLGASSRPTTSEEDAAFDDDVTTVLVVEDNAEVRAYLAQHLAPSYRVVEAVDGQVGLEKARALLPDLVISDVMMPRMDGVTLCRALKDDRATDFIPVLLLTARAAVEDKLEGLHEQADDYVTKPFDVREVLARVDNLIATRRQWRHRIAAGDLPSSAAPAFTGDDVFVTHVYQVIEAHAPDPDFDVTGLAENLDMDRSQLYRRLKHIDASPSALIWRVRLEQAARLLGDRLGSVSEVAYGTGFKSVSHFSKKFRQRYGVTPSAYASGERA